MQISWWRVCLDEAQMVESGVTNAARLARLIPRINAWSVTGTPVQKTIDDLFGLLLFLRVDPWCYNKKLWDQLLSRKKWFQALFHNLALRHTKDIVRDEIKLPAQKRTVISVPFSQVEEANYQRLFEDCCAACGVNSDGSPICDEWDPRDPELKTQMRTWLGRLRQTCVHPQVGFRNRQALGGAGAPLRTVDEVLDVMIEQNDSNFKTDQRAMHVLLARRAQMHLEFNEDMETAISLLQSGLLEVREAVSEIRTELKLYQKDINEAEITTTDSVTEPKKHDVGGSTQMGEGNQTNDEKSVEGHGESNKHNTAYYEEK